MKLAGFDWDQGNWPKCGKHGVSREEIEQVLLNSPAVMPDPHQNEPRMRAIGKTAAGRYVFLVFMLREIAQQTYLRPISARFMHQKEIEHYEDMEQKHLSVTVAQDNLVSRALQELLERQVPQELPVVAVVEQEHVLALVHLASVHAITM